jgi:TolA-binding protein
MPPGKKVRSLALVLVLALAPSGCLVLKTQHDELALEVNKLRKQVADQDKKTAETIKKSEELNTQLQTKLDEAEKVLRSGQAGVGIRVDQLEGQVQELTGKAENADYQASAVEAQLKELRAEMDGRLKQLEDKLNEATNIPEGKTELFAEAEALFKKKNYKGSRRLWRTYESRYPDDAKIAEVKFNIGLTYFSERDYKSALGEFYNIIQGSPNSPIVPDALYYSGLAFAKLGQCQNAIAYFDALRQKKTKAPAEYKTKANEQIAILEKDKGDICLDKKKKEG